MSEYRNSNGVLVRRDGGGDFWAQQHRTKLPRCWYLNDNDQIHRAIFEVENRENLTFSEVVFDSYANRGKVIRSCATICRIDRKKSVEVAMDDLKNGKPALVSLLQDCRNDRACQGGHGGRCFLVCGVVYPFTYLEINVDTGQVAQEGKLEKESSWAELYEQLGITSERLALEKWLQCGEATHA